MANGTFFTLDKQAFFAWIRFRQAFTYTREINDFRQLPNPYNLNLRSVSLTLQRAISASLLSFELKEVARDLFLRHYTKKELIALGRATIKDFAAIRSHLAATIGCYTRCEQEKLFLEDFFENHFYHPTLAPFLILYTPLSYDTISHLTASQSVLSEDEEALLTLFLLGDIADKDLTNAQRLIIIDAVHKLEKGVCR